MLNKVDDGVLLVRLGPVVTQMMPYGQTDFLLTINYVRLTISYQMLNDGDDGVLLVRLGTVVTQMMPYRQPGKEELTCQN